MAYDTGDASGPFEFLLDSVGGSSLEACFRLVSESGIIVSYGNSSDQPARFSFETMYHAGRSQVRFYFNYQNSDERLRRNLQIVMDLVAARRLKAEIGHLAAWPDIGSPIEELRARRVAGKAILRLDPSGA